MLQEDSASSDCCVWLPKDHVKGSIQVLWVLHNEAGWSCALWFQLFAYTGTMTSQWGRYQSSTAIFQTLIILQVTGVKKSNTLSLPILAPPVESWLLFLPAPAFGFYTVPFVSLYLEGHPQLFSVYRWLNFTALYLNAETLLQRPRIKTLTS